MVTLRERRRGALIAEHPFGDFLLPHDLDVPPLHACAHHSHARARVVGEARGMAPWAQEDDDERTTKRLPTHDALMTDIQGMRRFKRELARRYGHRPCHLNGNQELKDERTARGGVWKPQMAPMTAREEGLWQYTRCVAGQYSGLSNTMSSCGVASAVRVNT